MYQSVYIPANANTATLKMSYWNQCEGGGTGDYQTIYVYNQETGATTWIQRKTVCDNDKTWKSANVDLASFKGKHAVIYVRARKATTANANPVQTVLACQNNCVSVLVT